ncbi:MAG: DUF5703 domain-containing protein [Verrucomicrobiota bacterium]
MILGIRPLCFSLILAAFAVLSGQAAMGAGNPVDAYNVAWATPSKNSSGSMPLGNGEVGINLWVEAGGDLLFYISRTDAWDEHARLVKLGRVRVKLSPNPFANATSFRQELRLRQGEAVIVAGETQIRVWVDSNRPVIWLEATSKSAFDTEARVELWRTEKHAVAPAEASAVDGFGKGERPLVYPDTVAESQPDWVVWYHRNTTSLFPATMNLQGLARLLPEFSDPLLNRTFGATLRGSDMTNSGSLLLKSNRPAKRFVISATTLTAQTATPTEWLARMDAAAKETSTVDLESTRKAHEQWWEEFWKRSWMRVSGGDAAETANVSIGWHLSRYQNACAGRGAYPLKFNGSIFNVDGRHTKAHSYAGNEIAAGDAYSADFREWGGCYWFQNTRHMYWPMLAAGDFDLMLPLFRMYRDMLPLARRRTQIYFRHEGAFFPETLYFWGAYFNDASLGYGWNREGKHLGRIDNGYTRYYWQGGLELLAMMLDYESLTGDAAFTRETLLPFADAVTKFYDTHYSRDESGKLRFEPANALETFWDVVNPSPEIAGLERTLKGLLALPATKMSVDSRQLWQRMLSDLPAYPIREKEGRRYLAAAETIRDKPHNRENVAMWTAFPYRIFGVGKPDLEMIRHTFETRPYPHGYGCWGNDNTSAAYVGLASEARKRLAERFVQHGEYRFPACYMPGDWSPDLDNGGNAQMALQAMLMQADGRDILLFPAWPREWDVEFKLHAPLNTTVEGVYRGGKLRSLIVSPASRRKDVTQLAPQLLLQN